MKKFSIIFASLMVLFAFSSCEQETDPRYKDPTQFVLNTPALAKQLLELTPDGTASLTCSQPDYGYSAVTEYSLEAALDESFEKIEEIKVKDKNSTEITFNQSDLSLAICKLLGVESEEDFNATNEVRKVYFRAIAQLAGVESSRIVSNVVALEQVYAYYAIEEPGFIYLVGAPEGWAGPDAANAAHYEPWKLTESSTAIGSKIYSGVFEIPAGQAMFRFYTELTGWDGGASIGLKEADEATDVDFDASGFYEGTLVSPGKGSLNFPGWEGGTMKIIVNMSNASAITVSIEANGVDTNDKEFIYLVGAPEGWAGPDEANASHYETWKLYDLESNKVYVGTFDIPADKATFRFYTALTGWDGGASIGSQVDDAAIDYSIVGGVVETAIVVPGKGSYNFTDWEGGRMKVTVDLGNKKVKFEKA